MMKIIRRHIGGVVGLLVAWSVPPGVASADQEAPALYDARSAGMGGTGYAFCDSGAAPFFNPANMDLWKKTAVTLAVTPTFGRVSAPFAGPGTETDSTRGFAPFFLVGGGYRVQERLVIGLSAYVTGGVGSSYQDVEAVGGEDLKLAVGLGEVSLPISVRILDNLSFGVAFRVALAFQNSDAIDPTSGERIQQSQLGVGIPGFLVGINYRPIQRLRLSLTYKSRVDIDLSGDTTLPGDLTVHSDSEWFLPHSVQVESALSLLQDALLLAVALNFQFYDQSHNTVTTMLAVPPDGIEQTVVLNWQNTITGKIGAEYRISKLLSVRAGYIVGNSAVPKSEASPFLPTPGVLQAVTAGVGFDVGDFELATALIFSFAKTDVTEVPANGTPGVYKSNSIGLALSGTFRR
jgi:long-subunit fatty acid transport protein